MKKETILTDEQCQKFNKHQGKRLSFPTPKWFYFIHISFF